MMDTAGRSESIGAMFAGAFGWGVLSAFATAAAGFVGHLIGSQLYPQQYEQIPSDFFFVPLGLLAGFVAAGTARLTAREWGAFAMMSFVGLASVAYGGVMFQYSRVRAIPARISAIIEPEPIDGVVCTPDKCDATSPPLQWYATGRLRVKETSGLGATVDRIEISSDTYSTGPVTPIPYTKERAAEAARWRGPNVTLAGGHIPGPRTLGPNVEVTYPLGYAYHTPEGTSRRQVSISVYLTDRAGRRAWASVVWHVR